MENLEKKILLKIEADYFSGSAHDLYMEEINELINEINIFCVVKNNRYNNIVEDLKKYSSEIEDFTKNVLVNAKGYSQGDWQTYIIYYNDYSDSLDRLIKILKKTFTHKNDYWVNKYEVITVDGEEYTSDVIDSTSFSIIDIEFPETEDIIAEYNFMYGADYDKIEVEIN
jgi:hypothetical protein